jgi:hypothetical protein
VCPPQEDFAKEIDDKAAELAERMARELEEMEEESRRYREEEEGTARCACFPCCRRSTAAPREE